MQEGNKDRTAKGSSGARARVCWSRGLCPWALRTQVTPSASWAWGQRVRWERRVRCTWGFPGTPLVSAERSSPCPPPADAETREQKVMEPSFSPSPGFSDLSASFTAFAEKLHCLVLLPTEMPIWNPITKATKVTGYVNGFRPRLPVALIICIHKHKSRENTTRRNKAGEAESKTTVWVFCVFFFLILVF